MPKSQSIVEYLETLEHPLRAAIDEVRAAISGADPEIVEIVKWNAPTFTWRGEYLATIHVKETRRVMVIFHNALTPMVSNDLLEGTYPDGRRMVYLENLTDVRERSADLRDVVNQLTKLIEAR